MTKAIFDTRDASGYDDDIVTRYHFPDRYLPEAMEALGDWIVYREPSRGGGRGGYFAAARIEAITPDPGRPRHSYAAMSGYLAFDAVVPLRGAERFYEARLDRIAAPALRGAALRGRSVRTVSDEEFGAIARAGLRETLDPANAVRLGLDPANAGHEALALAQAPEDVQERRMGEFLSSRPIRDAAFRRAVLAAYGARCAVTGLRIVNGGGKAEAQAAHIVPVADGGPDVVRNGIALSGTAHWLFDRHLISLTDDYGLLVSHNKVPAELRGLFARQLDRIHLPEDPALRPHLGFVQRHRERFAAG